MAEFWFDKATGELLEDPAVVAARDGTAVALGELLGASEFDIKTGDYPLKETRDWGPDDYLTFGKWALNVVEVDNQPRPLTRRHVKRLRALGLGPPMNSLGSFTAYKDIIGSPMPGDSRRFFGRNRDLQMAELIGQADKVATMLGHKPRKPEYEEAARAGHIAAYSHILRITGGVTYLNDLIGYPNYSEWDRGDFINYGVQFIGVNGLGLFAQMGVDLVAQKGRGPWTRSISYRFGAWSDYRQLVASELAGTEAARSNKIQHYKRMIDDGRLPEGFGGLDDSALLAAAGRYRVINDCIPDLTPARKRDIALKSSEVLARSLIRYSPTLTAGYVEMVAVTLNLFDDIWPQTPNQHLCLSVEEIERAKSALAEKARHSRRKHRRTRF